MSKERLPWAKRFHQENLNPQKGALSKNVSQCREKENPGILPLPLAVAIVGEELTPPQIEQIKNLIGKKPYLPNRRS